MCPWRKTPAAVRTKSLSLFSRNTPVSSLNQPPFPRKAPFGPTAPSMQEEFQAWAALGCGEAPGIGL